MGRAWSPRCGHSSARGASAEGPKQGTLCQLSGLPGLSGYYGGLVRVPFVTLSRALLCQHGVGKWLCLTRTCRVCDLAVLLVASASPKLLQVPSAGHCTPLGVVREAGTAGVSLLPSHRMARGRSICSAQPWRCIPRHSTLPHAAPAAGVLTHTKCSDCPCDFACASARKFRACRTPRQRVSAAPAASSCGFPPILLLSTHCGAFFFFNVLLPREGKREKAE